MGVVLVAGEKGGVGKSTIAQNLAAWVAIQGGDVVLLDTDPQATSASWAARRNKIGNLARVHSVQKMGDDVHDTAMDLASRYQHVIIDAGGRDSVEMRSAMLAANRLYTPFRASWADLETLTKVLRVYKQARAFNRELQAWAVLAQAPTHPNPREVEDAKSMLADFPDFPLTQAVIRERIVYRDALLQGLSVFEMHDAKAKTEAEELAKEVFYG